MNKNENKIAITGPFADVNFGDYAMLINNIYDLDIENITLFSYDNDFLSDIKEDYLTNYNINIKEVKIKNLKGDISDNNYPLTPIEVLFMIDNYDDLYEEINEIDTLIVNGGGYFNGLWSMPHRVEKLLKIIGPVLIANQLNKKIIFTGNGYGPFGNDSDFFASFFNILSNATFGLRDNLYSPMWLQQLGIKNDNMKNIPDDLFIINEKIVKQKNSLTIKSQDYIIMETYLPIDYIKDNINHFKDFTSNIYNIYGLNTVFLPLNLEHGGMDQALYLNEELEHFEYVDIRKKGYLPIQDAVEVIKNAKLVVSSRYHSLVVALSVETPTVSALKDVMGDKRYYYNKNNGMLRQVLSGTNFDERYYLRLDYLEALKFISNNFNEIIQHQKNNYNSNYRLNTEYLHNVRKKYLEKVINN